MCSDFPGHTVPKLRELGFEPGSVATESRMSHRLPGAVAVAWDGQFRKVKFGLGLVGGEKGQRTLAGGGNTKKGAESQDHGVEELGAVLCPWRVCMELPGKVGRASLPSSPPPEQCQLLDFCCPIV